MSATVGPETISPGDCFSPSTMTPERWRTASVSSSIFFSSLLPKPLSSDMKLKLPFFSFFFPTGSKVQATSPPTALARALPRDDLVDHAALFGDLGRDHPARLHLADLLGRDVAAGAHELHVAGVQRLDHVLVVLAEVRAHLAQDVGLDGALELAHPRRLELHAEQVEGVLEEQDRQRGRREVEHRDVGEHDLVAQARHEVVLGRGVLEVRRRLHLRGAERLDRALELGDLRVVDREPGAREVDEDLAAAAPSRPSRRPSGRR